jgi:lysozyme
MNHNRLIESVKHHEGYRQEPYKDTLGKWTVGYGTLIDDEIRLQFCNPDKHQEWLDTRLDKAIKDATNYASNKWDELTDAQREVLCEMAYQLGGGGLNAFIGVRQAIEDDDPVAVALEMKDSNWFKQTPNRVEDAIKKWGSE